MRSHTPLREVAQTLLVTHRQRSLVGLVLMIAQAFFLQRDLLHLCAGADRFLWHSRKPGRLVHFAVCRRHFLGPLLLGRLFDTLGRRAMITLTYGVSGVLLALSGYLFSIGVMTAQTPDHRLDGDLLLCLAGASAAYLTVSETFPLEVRALAIALFYAIGTGLAA